MGIDKDSATCYAWISAEGGGVTTGTTFGSKTSTSCILPTNGCVAFGYNSEASGITFASSYGGCAEGAADCDAWETVYTSGDSAIAGGITNWVCNICDGDDCNDTEYAPSPAP